MKITANRGKQNKIHILCDGEYSFTVDAEYWFSSPYKSVENIDDEAELAAFLEAVGSRCAFLAGLRLLSYHDQSKRELVGKLVRKGHKSEYALLAADRLEELGYIDDERYAQSLAESLLERKGMSVRGAKSALIQKGIVNNVAESLDFDPILRIIDLLNGKYSRSLSDEKGIKRTVAALQRLGYRWSDINSALRRIEVETEDFENV